MFDLSKLIDSSGTLYETHVEGWPLLRWRLLSLREHKVLSSLLGQVDDYYLYDQVFRRCFHGDTALLDGNVPFGYYISIGQLILELSSPGSAEVMRESLAQARDKYSTGSVLEHMKKTILVAFSTYTPKHLDEMTYQELLREFVMAENVLNDKYMLDMNVIRMASQEKPTTPYQRLELKDILTPQDIAKKQAKTAKHEYQKERYEQEKDEAMSSPTDWLDAEPVRPKKLQKQIAKVMDKRKGK